MLMKALSNPLRLRLIEFLGEGEVCQNVLAQMLGITPQSASYDLSVLQDAGIIKVRTEKGSGNKKFISLAIKELVFTMLHTPDG